MFPFNVFNELPPDVVMSIQAGAAMVFYYAIVLTAASLAVLITFDRIHSALDDDE